MRSRLRAVDSAELDTPYPADTRAGNYRLALDCQRIQQSNTWKLATRAGYEVQHAVLFLWFEAWQQIPCGTLPNDDEAIAAILGMPPAAFAVHRAILMRGWKRHADGRLYHEYLTKLVLTMLHDRRQFRARQAKHRSVTKQEDTTVSPVTTPLLHRDGHAHDVDLDVDVNRTTKAKAKVNTLRAAEPPAAPNGPDPGFVRFWDTYPATRRRVAKAKCLEKWRREHLEAKADEVVAHVTAMAKTRQWLDGYEPAPLTYLSQRRWEDGVPPENPQSGLSAAGQRTAGNLRHWLAENGGESGEEGS